MVPGVQGSTQEFYIVCLIALFFKGIRPIRFPQSAISVEKKGVYNLFSNLFLVLYFNLKKATTTTTTTERFDPFVKGYGRNAAPVLTLF